MTCREYEGLMIDALGDELSEEDRARFEEHLSQCADCRAEYSSLRETVGDMRALPAGGEFIREGVGLEMTGGAGEDQGRRLRAARISSARTTPRLAPLLRYAAAVLFAFGAGYMVGGGSGRSSGDSMMNGRPGLVVDAQVMPRHGTFQAAVAEIHARNPSKSGLAKCLTAMFPGDRS